MIYSKLRVFLKVWLGSYIVIYTEKPLNLRGFISGMEIKIAKCVHCKRDVQRNLIRNGFCPSCFKTQFFPKSVQLVSKENFEGSTPTPFVGHFGYPNLNVGIMAVPEEKDATLYDAPRYWAANKYDIERVMGLRSSLINSRFNLNVKKTNNKMLDIAQEIGMASKAADVEVKLKQKPQFRVNYSNVLAPSGPNATLENAKLTSNVKVAVQVEKAVSDTDLKSVEALNSLFSKGFDENFLSRLLSVGNLGLGKNRKLVPTRWSITAVDDTVAKNIIDEIKDYSTTEYSAYFGGHLGNYYLILCFPDVWSYELFETYLPTGAFGTDYESFDGRKEYASNTVGGYYAARLAVLEGLKGMRKQGSCLCLRFITDEYTNPLGVWVVREAARNSMKSKPLVFGDRELMLTYAKQFIKKKFGYDLSVILGKSIILNTIKTQAKLGQFF